MSDSKWPQDYSTAGELESSSKWSPVLALLVLTVGLNIPAISNIQTLSIPNIALIFGAAVGTYITRIGIYSLSPKLLGYELLRAEYLYLPVDQPMAPKIIQTVTALQFGVLTTIGVAYFSLADSAWVQSLAGFVVIFNTSLSVLDLPLLLSTLQLPDEAKIVLSEGEDSYIYLKYYPSRAD